jgi:peptide/nickel transport system ATP-binding protein
VRAIFKEAKMSENGSSRNTLLEVQNLKKYFPIQRGLRRKIVGYVKAVDDVSFDIYQGETLGLVGESGCGKSTTARLLLRAYDPTAGDIRFRMPDGQQVNISELEKSQLKGLWREMQMIFQDPYSSLNPRMTLLQLIGEPLIIHKIARPNSADLKDRVAKLLRVVGLRPEYMERYPHAFSGGQRQRIGIARALALNPSFIAADEAVSALDVSIQAQTINLLQDLQEEFNLTYLFITHDLSVVEHISDRVGVMYVGKLAELAPTEELFFSPQHPYTEALLSAVPKPDPRLARKRVQLQGEVADPSNPPSGCYFHPRCQYAIDRCQTEAPRLREVSPGHQVSCHRAEDLQLTGVLG